MPSVLADIGPLRRNRHFRNLWFGQLVSGAGSQLTVVAVAYQAYRISHSTFMVGLISSVALVPLLIGSLWGGSVADAKDRRRVLILTQFVLAATSAGLLLNATMPQPRLWPLFVCTAASAAFSGVDSTARKSALPMLVTPEDLTGALALQMVLMQWATVAGPAVAGLLITHAGLSTVYSIDVASFGASFVAVVLLPPLLPRGGGTPVSLRSVVEGFRFLRGQRFLASSFLIDIDAMVFGMPRAVFPALGTGLYGGGAATVGLLYAAPGAGALIGSVLTGWVGRVRRQGRAVVISVVLWGASIATFGIVPVLWVGLVLLGLAGAADVISSVFRNAILQLTVPEHLQGRLSGVFMAVVAGGPRLGDAETGGAAALGGPQFAVWSGGLACVVGAGLLVWRIPELWRTAITVGTPVAGEPEAVAVAIAEISESEPP